jgi:hypothetical protein
LSFITHRLSLELRGRADHTLVRRFECDCRPTARRATKPAAHIVMVVSQLCFERGAWPHLEIYWRWLWRMFQLSIGQSFPLRCHNALNLTGYVTPGEASEVQEPTLRPQNLRKRRTNPSGDRLREYAPAHPGEESRWVVRPLRLPLEFPPRRVRETRGRGEHSAVEPRGRASG